MRTIYSEKHKLRNPEFELSGGVFVPPYECPERAEIVLARAQAQGLGPVDGPKAYGLDPVLRVHDSDYVNFLETCFEEWKAAGNAGDAMALCWPTRTMSSPRVPRSIGGRLGHYALALDASISDGTWEAALASKDVALTAMDHVLAGDQAAFGLCRPPGHHAAADQFGGYCFLNNAAIAAQRALDQGACKIALLDVDFHHGNGTQHIFYERDDVLFLSLHGDPMDAFPYFLGHADETGSGPGEGFTANYPMAPGTGYDEWKTMLLQACHRIADYAPDMLVVSLGVDTFERDPISFFKLSSDDFSDYGRLLGEMGLPTVYLMEGGYAVDEIGINTVNVLQGHDSALA